MMPSHSDGEPRILILGLTLYHDSCAAESPSSMPNSQETSTSACVSSDNSSSQMQHRVDLTDQRISAQSRVLSRLQHRKSRKTAVRCDRVTNHLEGPSLTVVTASPTKLGSL